MPAAAQNRWVFVTDIHKPPNASTTAAGSGAAANAGIKRPGPGRGKFPEMIVDPSDLADATGLERIGTLLATMRGLGVSLQEPTPMPGIFADSWGVFGTDSGSGDGDDGGGTPRPSRPPQHGQPGRTDGHRLDTVLDHVGKQLPRRLDTPLCAMCEEPAMVRCDSCAGRAWLCCAHDADVHANFECCFHVRRDHCPGMTPRRLAQNQAVAFMEATEAEEARFVCTYPGASHRTWRRRRSLVWLPACAPSSMSPRLPLPPCRCPAAGAGPLPSVQL